MASSVFPIAISTFVKDFQKNFWNGDGSLSFTAGELADIIKSDPDITLKDLKQKRQSGQQSMMLDSGVSIQINHQHPLSFGAPVGTGEGQMSMNLTLSGGLSVRSMMVLDESLLDVIPQDKYPGLKELLKSYIVSHPDESLVLLLIPGKANAALQGSHMFSPAVSAGFHLEGGGGIEYYYCCPIKNDEELLKALKTSFATARLPQSSGLAYPVQANEILYTAFNGFIHLGGDVSFGYSINGSKEYSLGQLDLTSKLLVQAALKLQVCCQMTGAFKLIVSKGKSAGWRRVVVEKDYSSTFDFSLGVTIDANLSTDETMQGGLGLVEGIIGTKPTQVLNSVLTYAEKSPQEWRQYIDGCLKAVVAKYTGKAFDLIPQEELAEVLGVAKKIREQIDSLDDNIIGIYEKFLDKIDFNTHLAELKNIVNQVDPETQKEKLLQYIKDPELRDLVEKLADVTVGKFMTHVETYVQTLRDRLNQLDQLVNGKMKDEIRKFVGSVLDELNLTKISAELAKYDTPEKLKDQATLAAQGVVERLTGKAFDKIFSDPTVNEIITGINNFAHHFEQSLTKIGDLIKTATNQQGRVDLSLKYQKAKKGERLLDVEIFVGNPQSPDQEGLDLYHQATLGNFTNVLRKKKLDHICINSATFTDSLLEKRSLDFHIFGWDYSQVSSILTNIDRAIEVGDTGLVTVYKMAVEAERKTVSSKRATQLNYMLQVAGTLDGVFPSDESFRQQAVIASTCMKNLNNNFDFEIDDSVTSMDELDSYLQIAIDTCLISPEKKENLKKSLQKIKIEGASPENIGKVHINYTFSFDGEALGKALKTDYSKKLGIPTITKNEDALQQIYVNCLETCYRPSMNENKIQNISDQTIYRLYKAGIYRVFREDPQYLDYNWSGDKKISFESSNGTVDIMANYCEVDWCRVLYLNNVYFSQFLESFKKIFNKEEPVKMKDLEEKLQKFAKELSKLGDGDNRLTALPFLILDQMVRLTLGVDSPQRKAFLEITLYNPQTNKQLFYIPISS
jgi:hypothetical protein